MTTEDLVLTWSRPAESWFDAAPVGNGRLAAMVFGGSGDGRLQINDATVWSGTPEGPRAGLAQVLAAGAGPQRLAEVRQALRNQDYRRAESLLMSFEGRYSQEYLPFADLWLSFAEDGCVPLRRTLNLDNGVAGEDWELGDRRVERLTWASRPAEAICVAVAIDGGTVNMRLRLSSPLRTAQRIIEPAGLALGIEIPVDGAPKHEPDAEPLRYADSPTGGYDAFGAIAVAVDTDGDVYPMDGWLEIRGVSRVLLTVASSTSAGAAWAAPAGRTRPSAPRAEHLRQARTRAAAAVSHGADRLLREHEQDVRALLGGAGLTLGARRAGTVDVTSEVLSGVDEQLTATVLVQLGRYLLVSASRPRGGPPANLQGLWNDDPRPAWSSNYTININTQMNYWGAEPSGLSECHEPLSDLLDRLAVTGASVARQLYGARGWVAHHNTDMWGWALPVGMGHGNPSWAIWMMGGVWLAQHLWDRFEFTQDLDFLRERGWPLLRGCAEFCLDWLVDGENSRLDTVPSTSPENLFVTPQGGVESLSVSTAMDITLIRAVFTRCLAAADLLGLDDPVCAEIRAALPRLPLPETTSDGRLREWSEDHQEHDPQHRHLAPMIAVYPLADVDPGTTPELAAAARRVLERRGPGAMGWSWAWKIALRARLGDAAQARELLLEATRPLPGDPHRDAPVDGSEWGGLLPNLFSSHPPFQIDGNYGLMAAVLEMVVQSHGGVIRVLPAVPVQWPYGACHGIRCRGGLAVDIAWQGGELAALTVRRLSGDGGSPVRVRYLSLHKEFRLAVGQQVRLVLAERELVEAEVTATC
jgi:hypothetical protein